MMNVENDFQMMKMIYIPETKYGKSCCGVHNLLGSNISGDDHALPMVRQKIKVSHCKMLFRGVVIRKIKRLEI